MKLINNSPRNYIAFDVILEAGKVLEVEEKTAKIFLKQEGVEEYIDKKDVEKLKKELEELKQAKKDEELKDEETKKQTKKTKK